MIKVIVDVIKATSPKHHWSCRSRGFPDKFRDFLDACNSDVQPVSNGDVGLKVTEIMSGSLLSAKLGREISVEELYEIEALRTEPTPGWPIP